MHRILFVVICAAVPVFAQENTGSDWPAFLGPNHTGVATGEAIAEKWPEGGPPLVWEKKVGTGYSAPSVRGTRLVLHHRVAEEEIVECYDAKFGVQLWTYTNESDFEDPYGYNNGPRCTPLLTDKHCYTLGAAGHLACVELATGKKVWSRDLQADYVIPRAFFGVGCTPILEDGKLIVLVGGQRTRVEDGRGKRNCGVVAFDAKTGKPVWNAVGKSKWNGVETPKRGPYRWTDDEMVASYSSPIAATINGKRHVLCLMRQGLVSLDPKTGTENFKYWFRPVVHESVNAARPVVAGDKILLSAAYRLGSVLLKVNSEGTAVEELWKKRDNLLAHWSTPIVVDGFAYGFSGRHENEGELRCIDLKDGSVKWSSDGYDKEKGRVVYDQERRTFVNSVTKQDVPRPLFGRGSKIRVGNRFIILGERGLLALANIDSGKYDEIARTDYKQIHYPSWTAPVISRGLLYLRCEDALICVDVGKK